VPADATLDPATDPHRLPRTVTPVRYDLVLEPDLDEASFAGTAAVTVEIDTPVTRIVLNAAELEIDEAWLERREDGVRIEVAAVVPHEETERLTLELATVADPASWVVHLRFRGLLNDKLRGFYRSTFTDADGIERAIATTQFQATDARRAFPCWDEPDFKAIFHVTLVVPEELTAISNAGEIARRPAGDGKVAVEFADTMKMSTYLVAFVVGPLDVTDPVDVDGTPLRIVYPRGKGHLTGYALEVGAFCLRYFADYYGIVYPGDKLDLVAVPDFAFGAMENLGCVTFREVLLLVDPDEVTKPELQSVTDVIAHELAHMWFGDLVTMRWWNGIWLNEAFATFMEMLATDAFRPAWQRWVDFGLSRTAAFDVDALKSTRPIEYSVVSPDDAEGMFDILTYEKGAAVVRMLEQFLGTETFRDGIRRYLARHQFANTETSDLWDAIEEAAGAGADLDDTDAVDPVPVRRLMDSWIFQGGFPVVDVDLVDDGGTIRLTQEHFAYAGDLGEGDEDLDELRSRRWIVPVILTIAMNGVITVEKVLIEGDSVDVPVVEEIDWVLVNTEGTGFYRVRYAPDLLGALAARAQEALSPIERYGLVDDAWAAVLADDLSAPGFLEFVEGFGDETDLAVWQRVVGALHALDRLVEGDDRDRLRSRVGALLRPALDRLGTTPGDDEGDRERQLRAVLFGTLGTLAADPEVRVEARRLYDAATLAGAEVEPSLLAASIGVVAATGTAEDFADMRARFAAAATPQEELRFLNALADFDDPDLLRDLLAMSITDEVRTQNAPYLIRRALTNREHGAIAWWFVQDHWDTVNERFPSNTIVRMLEGIRSLATPDVAPEVFVFFETHEVPQGDKILAQHLERLEVNLAVRARESARLAEHLR
jgi:puromycin-sensitive aminopeptidase